MDLETHSLSNLRKIRDHSFEGRKAMLGSLHRERPRGDVEERPGIVASTRNNSVEILPRRLNREGERALHVPVLRVRARAAASPFS